MRLGMKEVGGSEVLAGALAGKSALLKLLELIANQPAEPEPLFLDFEGVSVATSSYLRESVIALRDYCRVARSSLYPILANAEAVVLDELNTLLREKNDAILVCCLDASGNTSKELLLGGIDDRLMETYALIVRRREADAGDLSSADSSGIGQTAWNNRLASLSKLGLVVERADGRGKKYRPVIGV